MPPLGLEAAAAAGLSGDVVGGSSSGTATPLRGYTPRNSIDMASLRLQQQQQQQQQAEEPWLGRLLSQQVCVLVVVFCDPTCLVLMFVVVGRL